MQGLRNFYAFCEAVIRIAAALAAIAFGLALLGGCAWAVDQGFTHPIVLGLLGLTGVAAFIIITRALGRIAGPPVPSVTGGASLETRRALRRAGMLGRRR